MPKEPAPPIIPEFIKKIAFVISAIFFLWWIIEAIMTPAEDPRHPTSEPNLYP
jgi:hypothetical protein